MWQGKPSSQVVSSATAVVLAQLPVAESQAWFIQAKPGQVTESPLQLRLRHESPVVQTLPSSHGIPSKAAYAQTCSQVSPTQIVSTVAGTVAWISTGH